jgi:glycosyltransferase involved in cell wall biosynthesis
MLGFARHLPKFGWNVSVVAPPSMPWEPNDDDLAAAIPPETLVHYAPYPQGVASKPLRKLFPYEAWLPAALRAARQVIEAQRPDAVLTSGPPHCVHLVGMQIQRLCRLSWVADFRDLWTQFARPIRLWRRPIERMLERQVVARADAVVANAPCASEALAEAFPTHAYKFVTITNGFDPERFAPHPIQKRKDGVLRILHSGELYAGRDPRMLFEAVRDFRWGGNGTSRGVRICFQGQNDDLADVVRRQRMAEWIEVKPHVPYENALAEMRRADILLVLDNPGRRIGVPAKLYEYFGAHRPILALAERDSDTAWALRESRVDYEIAPPNDSTAIRQALENLARRADSPPADASDQAASSFTREAIARRLAEVLDDTSKVVNRHVPC